MAYGKHSLTRSRWRVLAHSLRRNRGAMAGLMVILLLTAGACLAGFLFDYDTDIVGLNISEKLIPPCREHWFGTDDLGRDLFARVLYGTRYSLSIGFAATIFSLAVGGLFGVVSGYIGGMTDEVVMRLNDILSAVPAIMLGIVIAAALGGSAGNLILAIGLSGTPQFVRITRAAVLTARSQDYVEALRCSGLPEWRILFLHILPNCMSPVIVQVSLRIAASIIAISSLSFLGLGVPVPAPEWGNMLNQGRQFIRMAPYMTFFPGLAILITVLAFNLFGDGLRDALDPKLMYRR